MNNAVVDYGAVEPTCHSEPHGGGSLPPDSFHGARLQRASAIICPTVQSVTMSTGSVDPFCLCRFVFVRRNLQSPRPFCARDKTNLMRKWKCVDSNVPRHMNFRLHTRRYICRGPEVYFSSPSFQEQINHLTKLRSPVALGWPCKAAVCACLASRSAWAGENFGRRLGRA